MAGLWKKLKDRAEEEYKQLKEMGGLGAYIVGNATTVVAEALDGVGLDNAAKSVRAKRPDVVAVGGKVDEAVAKVVGEQIDSGAKSLKGKLLGDKNSYDRAVSSHTSETKPSTSQDKNKVSSIQISKMQRRRG